MNAQYATVCSLPVEQCQIQVQSSATQCSIVQILAALVLYGRRLQA